jgi:glycosyltransferase involved in cell wall biosynthesis/ubiquinone/menaquinone biosynthesis C-methylase UbiE
MTQQSGSSLLRPEQPLHGEGTTRYFDAVSSTYFDRYHEQSPAGHALRVRRQRVVELLDRRGGKVLDVGCGPGVMVADLLNMGYEVWGIDGSIGMILQCQKEFGEAQRARFVVGDAAKLPFPDELFDTVICMGVLPNVQTSEAALKEFTRVVKRNGTLLISFPNFLSPYATWKIAVFYPALALLRPIYYALTARPPNNVLYNVGWYRQRRGLSAVFTELHTARSATQVTSGLGAKVTTIVRRTLCSMCFLCHPKPGTTPLRQAQMVGSRFHPQSGEAFERADVPVALKLRGQKVKSFPATSEKTEASNGSEPSLKILLLSRNYPNNVMPFLGLWAEEPIRKISAIGDVRVISPVPYCPPLPNYFEYTHFRRIVPHHYVNNVEVWHPRFLTGPGYSLHALEATTYYWGVARQAAKVYREFRFDLIHAYFTYPDGVVAARLGQRYEVPVVITEQAPWRPWMDDYPRVRRQAVWASQKSEFHIAPSRAARNSIAHFTGESEKLKIIPNGVDGSVFTPQPRSHKKDSQRILFVGFMRFVKGVDLLLQAMRQLTKRFPRIRLTLVGGGWYHQYRLEEERLRTLTRDLGLQQHVEFVGMKPPNEVAEYMRNSSVLVLPSRSESFGAVLVEALACGTPIVATRCGGPEDIVTDEVGVLAPVDHVDSLADAIASVIENREKYDPARLRAYALANFDWQQIARRTVDLYYEAVHRFPAQRAVNRC